MRDGEGGGAQGGRRHVHLASLRRAVSRKSLISMICFGCESGSAGASRVVRRAARTDRRHSRARRTRGAGGSCTQAAGLCSPWLLLGEARRASPTIVLAWGPTILGWGPTRIGIGHSGGRVQQVIFGFWATAYVNIVCLYPQSIQWPTGQVYTGFQGRRSAVRLISERQAAAKGRPHRRPGGIARWPGPQARPRRTWADPLALPTSSAQ